MCDFVDLSERQQSGTEYCAYRVANFFQKKLFHSSLSPNGNTNNKEMIDKMPNISGMDDEQVKDLKYIKKTSSHSSDMASSTLVSTFAKSFPVKHNRN